ncbi:MULTISPECIES: DUF3040 domain-containing protein [Micromonospora]|uniref:DUF3040 domain-containing protein n=1 Tax=Micromonospora TaxID=1873 RepID=UPI000C7088DC|nr:DUF3040 domain-containing protein [Micromonospora sp. MSM11]MCL7457988.1 DUF3040 domain-containing protein [Micromonospora sp. MSM11]
MAATEPERAATRRRRLLWAGVLAVAGLVLLVVGLTVADGTAAWLEVAAAIVLLLVSYGLQYVARREALYRDDDRP